MSMRKAVDGATKPKRAAPKAKYIDPLVQATFSQDGQLQEIVRSLGARMRDPDATVAFKSLIVLHTLMRSGSIDAVFPYLASSSTSLSLSSSEAPNVAAYGHYLAARIKAFGNLKRDAIRDKSDRRNANRMRKLSVEQGLLRETREIQRMIAALVDSKFYTEDHDDDVSMTALRLLVKDLLVLFTVVNEGVINILENFFALSKPDCETALKIYKTFCRDTEKVVAYLGTAKKLYNVLHIPIPNLKHAPLSLANSLEEYLRDPNFESNRQEYKEVKRIADGGAPRATAPPSSAAPTASTSTSAANPATTSSTSSPQQQQKESAPKSFTDFFESIETAQTPMFAGSPAVGGFMPQPTGVPFNPFVGAQPTGLPFGGMGTMMPQMTGLVGNPFLHAQPTGFAPPMQQMPMAMPQQMMATGVPVGGGLAPQMTGVGMGMGMGMGSPNPFRQSMMMTGAGAAGPFGMQQQQQQQPQPTGMPFAPSGLAPPVAPVQQPQATGNPFGMRPMSMMPQQTGNPFGQQQQQGSSIAPGVPALAAPAPSPVAAQSPFSTPSSPASSVPPSGQSFSASAPAPLVAQKTGARNPFAPAPGTVIPQTAPPPPKQPSMYELAMQRQQDAVHQGLPGLQPQQTGYAAQLNGVSSSPFGQGSTSPGQTQQSQNPPAKVDAFSAFLAQQQAKRDAEAAAGQQGATPLLAHKTGGLMANIASDLAMSAPTSNSTAAPSSTSPFPGAASFSPSTSSAFAPLSSFSASSAPSTSHGAALSTPFSSLSISTSSATPLSPSLTGAHAFTTSPLSAQPTGTGGGGGYGAGAMSMPPTRKAFQPSSSFGSKLASEITASSLSPNGTGWSNGGAASSDLGQAQTQSSAQTGTAGQPQPLLPQSTGYNPFGGTKLPPLNTPLSAGLTAQPTGVGVAGSNPGMGYSSGFAATSGGPATASLI